MTPNLILEQFDRAAKNFVFPMLDNGYVYPADLRLSIFRDPTQWLMIVEVLGVYVPKVSGCDVLQVYCPISERFCLPPQRNCPLAIEMIYPCSSD